MLHIEEGLNRFGKWVEQKIERGGGHHRQEHHNFTRAFVNASPVICAGPIHHRGEHPGRAQRQFRRPGGEIHAGWLRRPGFGLLAGMGRRPLRPETVLVYQGELSLFARWARALLTDAMILEMSAAGGLLLLCIGLSLLGIKRVRTGNLLLAIFIAPFLTTLLGGFV